MATVKTSNKFIKQKQQNNEQALNLEDLFNREEKLSNLNWEKVDEKWETIFNKLKDEDLKNDAMAMRDAFEFYMNTKKEHLELLMEEFKEDAGNAEFEFSTFNDGLRRLQDIFVNRIQNIRRLFLDELACGMKILNNFSKEQNIVQELKTENLRSANYIQNQNAHTALENTEQVIREITEEANYEHQIRSEKLHLKMKKMTDNLLKQIEKWSMCEVNSEFEELKRKDDWFTNINSNQMKEIMKLKAKIQKLKCKLGDVSTITGTAIPNWISMEITDKEDERLKAQKTCSKKKKYFQNLEKKDEAKLLQLTVTSNDVTEFLEEKLRRRIRIFTLGQSCMKIEMKENGENVMSNIFHSLSSRIGLNKLEHFWEKLGHVELKCNELHWDIESLKIENTKLKMALLEFFGNIN